jgi:hypothetical protein
LHQRAATQPFPDTGRELLLVLRLQRRFLWSLLSWLGYMYGCSIVSRTVNKNRSWRVDIEPIQDLEKDYSRAHVGA